MTIFTCNGPPGPQHFSALRCSKGKQHDHIIIWTAHQSVCDVGSLSVGGRTRLVTAWCQEPKWDGNLWCCRHIVNIGPAMWTTALFGTSQIDSKTGRAYLSWTFVGHPVVLDGFRLDREHPMWRERLACCGKLVDFILSLVGRHKLTHQTTSGKSEISHGVQVRRGLTLCIQMKMCNIESMSGVIFVLQALI